MQGRHRFRAVFEALARVTANVGLGGTKKRCHQLSQHLGFSLGGKPDLTEVSRFEPEFQQLPGLERGRKSPARKYGCVLPVVGDDQAVGNERLELESVEPAPTKEIGPRYRFALRIESRRLGIGISGIFAPFPEGQFRLDDLQRKEVVTLQAQDVSKPLDFGRAEKPVARAGATRADQALSLEKPDLRDGHVGVVITQKVDDVTD